MNNLKIGKRATGKLPPCPWERG